MKCFATDRGFRKGGVSDAHVAHAVKQVVAESDLDATSLRDVRRAVEEMLGKPAGHFEGANKARVDLMICAEKDAEIRRRSHAESFENTLCFSSSCGKPSLVPK